MTTITRAFDGGDRLDLISLRVYPGLPTSEGIRALVWANPDLPPTIDEGTEVVIPDSPPPVQYAEGYRKIVN